MDLNLLIQTLIFLSLALASYFCIQQKRSDYFTKKSFEHWLIDILSLNIQGIVIPLAQVYLLGAALRLVFPQLESYLKGGPLLAIFLNLIVVDYLYYWFHRIYHVKRFWPLHFLHHSAEQMDVFVASRNNLWVSFVLPYFWFNGLFYFLVEAKSVYLFCVALTAMLDLWRHSEVFPDKKNGLYRLLARFLITPYEHAWHHSRTHSRYNYGANLNLWDKVHGTYFEDDTYPSQLGFSVRSHFFDKMFRPFKMMKDMRK